jgi:hypothetical protein
MSQPNLQFGPVVAFFGVPMLVDGDTGDGMARFLCSSGRRARVGRLFAQWLRSPALAPYPTRHRSVSRAPLALELAREVVTRSVNQDVDPSTSTSRRLGRRARYRASSRV